MVEQGCMSTYQLQMANGKMWCPTAHDYFEPKNMAPAYTVLAGIASEIMDHMFSPGQASLHNHAAQLPLHQRHGQDFIRQGRLRHCPHPQLTQARTHEPEPVDTRSS
jgi:hypothetical protein